MFEVFGKKMYETVIKGGAKDYKTLFANSSSDSGCGYWHELRSFYDELDEERKDILFNFVEIVMIDTVSHVLGILDGSSSLAGGGFFEPEIKINGEDMVCDLQDSFLAYVEEQEKCEKG